MVYSLRNLLISFAIVILVVLLIVLRTFSALRSQEKEQAKITRSREALQKLGPAIISIQQFESVFNNYLSTGDSVLLVKYNNIAEALHIDSANMAGLAVIDTEDSASYNELAFIIHNMITRGAAELQAKGLLQGGTVLPGWHSIPFADNFKSIAGKLEDKNKEILNSSYGHSIRLTRETFAFVRIISGLLILILVVGFYFTYHDIKTRKKTEEQLQQFNARLEKQVVEKTAAIRKSEEKYRSLFESMTDAYAKVDMAGKVIGFNPAFKNMIGYSDPEIYTLSYSDITPAAWHAMENEIIQSQVLINGYSDVFEKEYIHKNGKIFPVELRTFLLKNDTGKPLAMWAIIRDISARKEAKEKLQESEKNLRHVLSSTSDIFYVLDKNFRVTLINEVAEKNLKKAWGTPVVVGTYIPDLIPGNNNEPIRDSLDKVFAGERVEYELYHSQPGLPPWVLVTYTPVLDEAGKIIGAYILTKDITKRKKAEKEKENAYYLLNERVKELTTLYQVRQIFQTEKKSVKDILQEIVSVLPTGWQHAGVAAARIVLGDMEFKTQNFGTAFHQQTATFPVPGDQKGLVEIIYLEQRPAESEDAFLAEERNLINMVADMLRIYFARLHEAELTKKMEQEMLNQKIQEQKTVTRAVLNAEERERNKIGRELHDNVNQILASVKLFLKMALKKDSAGEQELLDRSVTLIDSAIEEIRSLSQRQVTPLKMVDLEELIQTLVDRLDDSTSITTTFTYDNVRLIDDELKLNIYRIIQEQVSNILKYAEATEITIRLSTDNDFLLVLITDNGKGFDPESKRKGIGISNMINRVESFNGELEIESSPGNGCRIEIRIPC